MSFKLNISEDKSSSSSNLISELYSNFIFSNADWFLILSNLIFKIVILSINSPIETGTLQTVLCKKLKENKIAIDYILH